MQTHQSVWIFAVYFTSGFTAAQEACDSGWEERQGFCYKMFTQAASFENAKTTCMVNGGHLVSIHSETEDSFVQQQQTSLAGGAALWLGLKRLSSVFIWIDGTDFDFSNVVSDPTPYQGECVAKFPSWQNYDWVPSNCLSSYGFICKKAGVYSEWSVWGSWSPCNCNDDTQIRVRECVDTGGNPTTNCPGEETQTLNCQCSNRDMTSTVAVLASKGFGITNTANWTTNGRHAIECTRYCLTQPHCVSFLYNQKEGACHMFSFRIDQLTPVIAAPDSSLWFLL